MLNLSSYLYKPLYYNFYFLSDNLCDKRLRNQLAFLRHRMSKFRVIFSYTTMKYYNTLSSTIKSACSSSAFRFATESRAISNFLFVFFLIYIMIVLISQIRQS